jgi:hypothetical protein
MADKQSRNSVSAAPYTACKTLKNQMLPDLKAAKHQALLKVFMGLTAVTQRLAES